MMISDMLGSAASALRSDHHASFDLFGYSYARAYAVDTCFYPLRMRFELYFLRDLSVQACRRAQTASLKCKAHLLKV